MQNNIRRTGIGGSDVASVLGIRTAFKTPLQVWREKYEGFYEEPKNKRSMMLGKMLEFPMVRHYASHYENIVEYCHNETFTNNVYPYFFAHIDAHIPSEKKIIEIKTTSNSSSGIWGKDGSQDIPEHYHAQIAHYMLVLNYKSADLMVGFISDSIKEEIEERLCAYFLGNKDVNLNDIPQKIEVRKYSFDRNEDIDNIIIKKCNFFWENHVLTGIPPSNNETILRRILPL